MCRSVGACVTCRTFFSQLGVFFVAVCTPPMYDKLCKTRYVVSVWVFIWLVRLMCACVLYVSVCVFVHVPTCVTGQSFLDICFLLSFKLLLLQMDGRVFVNICVSETFAFSVNQLQFTT